MKNRKYLKGIILKKTMRVIMTIIVGMLFFSCDFFNSNNVEDIEMNDKTLSKIHVESIITHPIIKKEIELYIDYSTCVIDAVKNSIFFKNIRPRITGLQPTLISIKGLVISKVSSDMDAVNNELNSLQEVSYANIAGAIEKICDSDHQNILITDGEYWTSPEGERTDLPYMKESFKKWLLKGYVVHVIVEDYKELFQGKLNDKKRFYFLFTDDRLEDNVFNEISKAKNFKTSNITVFKLSNVDLKIERSMNLINEDLGFEVDTLKSYDVVLIENKWEDIFTYVLNGKDENGEEIKNGKPFIMNLKLHSKQLENFEVNQIEIKAYLITDLLSAEKKTSKKIDISEGFKIDNIKFKKDGSISINLTDKLNEKLLTDQQNILQLDIVLKSVSNSPFQSDLFSWTSLSKPNNINISVAESIKQTLDDADINPMKQNKGVVHRIFIKTLENN